MENVTRQRIQQYLQNEEVQTRIRGNIQRARMEATVTIGRAAQLFGFSESKLRELESIGLLKPTRKENKGQRQFSLNELDKLAIIRELYEAKYSITEIPADIAGIWSGIVPTLQNNSNGERENHTPIDQRIEADKSAAFWRYYTTHAVRMSLMLIREMLPNAPIGLILPLRNQPLDISTISAENLPGIGNALVGWLNRNGSSHIFFTPRPVFEYHIEYSLYPLVEMRNERLLEVPQDNTLLVLERPNKRYQALSLDNHFVMIIRRLLAPLYEEAAQVQGCFDQNMRDAFESATNLNSTIEQDRILEGLANMVVRMGGQGTGGTRRWRFSHVSILDVNTANFPLYQRNIITCAQSEESPYHIGKSFFSPQKSATSIGIRAFQSGHVIYRPELTTQDRMQVFATIEGPIRSNIAIPIGAEQGQPFAVLYVASDEVCAFTTQDIQLLRMMGRLIENVLATYQVLNTVTADFKSMLRTPRIVDPLFGEFLSENDFMRDVESLMTELQTWSGLEGEKQDKDLQEPDDVISFITLDLDDQEVLASRYGEQIIRHLNKTVGLRVQELIAPLTTKHTNCQLYYIYAARFYLILRGFSLEKAREKAEQFRASLEGSISVKLSESAESVLIIPGITIHLGVTSYPRTKLEEFLQEYSSVAEISAMVNQTLDVVLKLGVEEKGNVVMSWGDGGLEGYRRWSPSEQ